MTQRSIGSLALLTVFPLLTACGRKTVENHSAVFRQSGDLISPKVGPAECNAVTDTDSGISGAFSLITDPNTQDIDFSKVRLRLFQVPTVFNTHPQAIISLTRWGYDSTEGEVHDPQAAQIYVVLRSSGALLNPNQPLTEISQSSVAALLQNAHLQIDFQTFFTKVDFLIPTLEIKSMALAFSVSDGGSTLASFSALVPTFSVNPNTYAEEIPAADLQVLHPQWTSRDSGWTNPTYAYYFQEVCRSF